MIVRMLPIFPENPSNPARCWLDTGEIEINAQAWSCLTPEQQRFVLQHEIGHYACQTLDEQCADRYALEQLAFTAPNSLWNFYDGVRSVARCDQERIDAAKIAALRKAAADGSVEAQRILGIKTRTTRCANATGEKRRNNKIFLILALLLMACLLIRKLMKK